MTEHERIASAVADMTAESVNAELDVQATDPSTPFDLLTARERECALLIAIGLTNREIAERMDISVKTVDTHRLNAVRKLGVRNNVELCRLAIACEVVTVGGRS